MCSIYGRKRRSALKAQVMRNDLLFILLVTQFNWNLYIYFKKGGGPRQRNIAAHQYWDYDVTGDPTVKNLNKIETFTLVLHIEPKFTFSFQHVTENV